MANVRTHEVYRIMKQVPRVDENGQPNMEPQPEAQPIDEVLVEDYDWYSSPPTAPIGARIQNLTMETGMVHIAVLISSEQEQL